MAYDVYRDFVLGNYYTGNCGGDGSYGTSEGKSADEMIEHLTVNGLDDHLPPLSREEAEKAVREALPLDTDFDNFF